MSLILLQLTQCHAVTAVSNSRHSLGIRNSNCACVSQLSAYWDRSYLIKVLFAHCSPLSLEYFHSAVGMCYQPITDKTNLSTVWIIPNSDSVCRGVGDCKDTSWGIKLIQICIQKGKNYWLGKQKTVQINNNFDKHSH